MSAVSGEILQICTFYSHIIINIAITFLSVLCISHDILVDAISFPYMELSLPTATLTHYIMVFIRKGE